MSLLKDVPFASPRQYLYFIILKGVITFKGLSLLPCTVQSNKWLPSLINGQEEPKAFNQSQRFFIANILQRAYSSYKTNYGSKIKTKRTILPSYGKLQLSSNTALNFQGM